MPEEIKIFFEKICYKKFLLAIFFIIFVTCGGYYIYFFRKIPEFLPELKNSFLLKNQNLFDFSEIYQAREKLISSEIWKHHENFLFASPSYVWKENKLINPFENLEDLHPPIPNEWLIKYHLEYWRSDLLELDLKRDGFTVLENYLTNTHPTDLSTHAPAYIKLKLKKSFCSPLRVKFSGTPDDGKTFSLNIIDVPFERTRFLKIGESITIRDISYILKKYQKKTYLNSEGLEIDRSELTLEANKEKIVFCFDQEIDFPLLSAVFKYFEEEIEIKKGEIFTLKNFHAHPYQLLEVSEKNAWIQNVATGQKHLISQ